MTIQFDNVQFTYPGSSDGVHDINLTVTPGELLAVIGASGSGKTTLLKLLSGFLMPTVGRIVVDGEDVSRTAVRDRNLGIVFQSYALFQHMNAWRNVAYPLKVRGWGAEARKARAMEALETVGLAGMEDRLPSNLSGGQQQRVALARALVFEPRALLLDEPLSALDASLRVSMRDEITRVQREVGITTLLVTHDQEEALSMADRVAVMERGRIQQIATPQELYDAPSTRSVAAFVGRSNLWEGQVVDVSTVQTPFGVLRCDTSPFTEKTAVTVLVRPEGVLPLFDGPTEGEHINVFRGAVEQDRFLGSVRSYDLMCQGFAIRGETSLRGDIPAVSVPPEAIRLLPV